ncbi:MAG: tetratricopeptide repeat protein, partial [Runella sp.]
GFFGGVLWLCMSCESNDRQRTYMPPLPTDDVYKRAQVGVEYLSGLLRRGNRTASNYHKRAELYMVLRQWPQALEDIEKALDDNPTSGQYLFAKARVLRHLKRYDEALAAARQAEVLGQDTPDLYVLLGDLTQEKQQFRQAKLYLAKALQMAPYEGEAYYYSGLLDARQGDTLSAIALIQRALELRPRFAPAYSELTQIYTRLKEYDQARAINNQGLRYFPKEAPIHYARGLFYHTQKRLDSALICYRKTINFDSTFYLADFQAGTIYLKWYSYPQAIRSFEKVLRFDPKYPQAHFLLASAYDKIGNLEKAIEYYALATEANPADWRARGRLYRAQQRKNYFDTYGTLPPAAPEVVAETEEETPQKTLDPERVQVEVLTPKLEFKTKIDTARSFKIKQ